MVARNASSVAIVSSGMFTQEAKNFADGKPINLIDGIQLNRLISGIQVSSSQAQVARKLQEELPPSTECPNCGSELVRRVARRGGNAGKKFVGCSGFPKCRYTEYA